MVALVTLERRRDRNLDRLLIRRVEGRYALQRPRDCDMRKRAAGVLAAKYAGPVGIVGEDGDDLRACRWNLSSGGEAD
jgi:hypothetical protein